LLNESALLAARRNKEKITMDECEESIDRVLMGPERKSKIISEKEKKVTAFHEAGHALVAKLIPDANPVRKVTILPRGMALGVTWTMPTEDKYTMSKKELLAEICTMMGGRCAEEIIFDEITTGASNDLKRASELARKMVTKYGMSALLGPLTFGNQREQVFLGRDLMEERNYSEDIANQIDQEVRTIAESCHDKAKTLLNENRETLNKIAEVLLEREIIEELELDAILEGTYDQLLAEQEEKKTQEKLKEAELAKSKEEKKTGPTLAPLKGPDLATSNG
jgi:cell division protease FtsH